MVTTTCAIERIEDDMRSELKDRHAATLARESAEAKVRSVWVQYQQAEKTIDDLQDKYLEVVQFRHRTGMELGKACFDLRSSAEVVTGGTTFRKDLERLGLNPKTAYKWLSRYEKKLLAEKELANRSDAQRVAIDELITSGTEKKPDTVTGATSSNEDTFNEEVRLEEEPAPRFTRQRQTPVCHAALFSDDLVRFASLLPFAAAQIAYREAAKTAHPDHGGSVEDMQALNQAWEQVKSYYETND